MTVNYMTTCGYPEGCICEGDELCPGPKLIEARNLPFRMCSHPESIRVPRELPAMMLGSCKHNMACPVCGFGWGQFPDPCASLPDGQPTR